MLRRVRRKVGLPPTVCRHVFNFTPIFLADSFLLASVNCAPQSVGFLEWTEVHVFSLARPGDFYEKPFQPRWGVVVATFEWMGFK